MPTLLTACTLAVLLAAGAPGIARPALHAQSVGIQVAPSAQRVQWDDDLVLDDDWMYGGRLLLRFGPWLELQPFYFTRDGAKLDSARLASQFGFSPDERTLDIRHYGTSLQVNLARGTTVPFLRAGAGVLRLAPDSGARQDRVAVSFGAGLRFGAGGVNAELFAEQLGFRMAPRSLFGRDTAGSPVSTLRNVVYGAAVTIPIAPGNDDPDADALGGTSVPIEPFVGRLQYAGAFGLADQELIGVRAGVDLSPIAGLRGFYWRGVNDDRDGPAPVSAYGAEAQFNLNTGPGVSPYLVLGGGQLDFRRTARDSTGASRADRTAFIVGGGLSIQIADRLRLNASIRDYMMTTDEELGDIASTGDLTHSTLLSAGVTVSVGGRSMASASEEERVMAREREARMREMRERCPRCPADDMDAMRSRRDTGGRSMAMHDTSTSADDDARDRDSVRAVRQRGTSDGRWITVPVPEVGEVILRYGLPAGRDSAMRGVAMRGDTTPPTVTPSPGAEAAADRLAELERRLMVRLEALRVKLDEQADALAQARLAAAAADATPPRVTVVSPGAAADVAVVDREVLPLTERFGNVSASDLQPYVGLGTDDDDLLFVAGVRADLGPIRRGSSLRYVPELAIGIGEGPLTVTALANVRFTFGSLDGSGGLRPYVTLGGGIHSRTVLAVNTAVGSSFPLRRGSAERSPLHLHAEVQGLNLFQELRVLFSLSRSGALH